MYGKKSKRIENISGKEREKLVIIFEIGKYEDVWLVTEKQGGNRDYVRVIISIKNVRLL